MQTGTAGMPRKRRLHAPGGIYHVALRGNHRQDLFRRDADRDRLDTIVQDSLAACGARVHAFTGMTAYAQMSTAKTDDNSRSRSSTQALRCE